jgi:lysophospholipase L1-like esterase
MLPVYNARMTSPVNAARVVAKGLLVFVACEFGLFSGPSSLKSNNAYQMLHLTRQRLPISTLPPLDDALDVGNLDAMLGSHIVSRPKGQNEYRVLVLGDSAVWGLQLDPNETLPSQLDQMAIGCRGKDVRVYNLSFPRSSASKDLLILDHALAYKPDLVVWLITWYTLMPKTRTDHWLVTQNPDDFLTLGRRFDFMPRDYQGPTLLDELRTHNQSLFHEARYQLYPLIEMATDREQIAGPPENPPPELSADLTFEGLKPPTLRRSQVSLDQIQDFYDLAGVVPVLLVNEPMQIVRGESNSDVRYNNYYPKWIYDQYLAYLRDAAKANAWNYIDLWDHIPESYFTDTPLHLSPAGQHLLAEMLVPPIQQYCR